MPQNGAAIDAVVFDVGETILDETWEYGAWADWLDVPRHTFSSVFGAVIATGGDYRDAFQRFRPGFDLHAEREKRADAGVAEVFTADDLYQDAVGCLSELCALGIRVGLAGNQTARNERTLRGLDLPVDFIGTSENWGVEKPDDSFFEKVVEVAGVPRERILYVGDRLDNDVWPAQRCGLATAWIRRGPWGYILRDQEISRHCRFVLDTLTGLPALVAKTNANADRG
ncbi:HAD family hydrolase [Amycolatopsis sp. NBC_01480]|uniref:HAD family hydrolase n=1 Tax=Amycolatopsis sp. NBC_01480 TaxID=2903562 RepID=UPI002E2C6247|nr:HAD family hydrolase [Amycolatopsis sp. NBC_01480]